MSLSDREAGDIIRRIINLEEGVKELRSEVKSMDGKVDGILSRFDRIDGGWKTLMFLGGIAGTVGAVITAIVLKIWPLFLGTLPRI